MNYWEEWNSLRVWLQEEIEHCVTTNPKQDNTRTLLAYHREKVLKEVLERMDKLDPYLLQKKKRKEKLHW